jgi:hypothetical protein
MEDDFAAYTKAVSAVEAAEQQGNEMTQRIKSILSPLFSDWRDYCLSGLSEETPHILTKLGSPVNRKQIYVGSIIDDLKKLQSSMAKYAEAMEAAMAAHGRIPVDQRTQLRPAPWHVSGPYKIG